MNRKRANTPATPPPPVKREVDHSLADRLLPLSAVMELAGLGKTIIYKKMKAGTFPKCCKPGGASSRWSEQEVLAWREGVMAIRDSASKAPPIEGHKALQLLTRRQAMNLTTGSGGWREPSVSYFRLFMPYVLKRVAVPGKRHAFLPLNRDYMPIGMRRDGAVSYEDLAPAFAVYFVRDPALLKDVFWKAEGNHLWLYDDSPASRIDYFARLEKLMTGRMEMVA